MKDKLSLIVSFVVGAASYLVGGFDTLITVFATIVVVDTATGMLKAWNKGEYQSKKFRSGFAKTVSYLLGVILAVQIDLLLGSNFLRDATLTFFIINEALSVVENLGELGVTFPQQFTDAIKSLQNKDKEGK